jgi:hypothetical protein
MRKLIRISATWLLVGCVLAIVVSVFGEFFIKVAEDKGLYSNAGKKWDGAMNAISQFIMSGLFLYPVAFLGGLVAGLWVDVITRKKENSNGDISYKADTELAEKYKYSISVPAVGFLIDPNEEKVRAHFWILVQSQ